MREIESCGLDLPGLRAAYEKRAFNPVDLVKEIYRRIAARGDDGVWTALVPESVALARANALSTRKLAELPLYGIPFAIKDNIDAAGLDTTASCPAFAYRPERSATTVERLLEAGAILIGKNTMDQFATGLVGIRAPKHPVNSFDPDYIPGGSSSGSAIAVAEGLVSFALGSDTGGSGRIPAALNNIVGLKPTPGIVSTAGMVYANRSFDCVPVFALSCADAWQVLDAVCGADDRDPFQRRFPLPAATPLPEAGFRIGVPLATQREFFGDADAARCFERAMAQMEALGGEIVEIDYAPFVEAGRMLFEGPALAERFVSIGGFIEANRDRCDPVVSTIIDKAKDYSALDMVSQSYRVRELQAEADRTFSAIDAIMLPTAATIYRIDEVRADPVRLNMNMGYYTYFVNLLELSALAVPAGLRANGLPFGICLVGAPGQDAALVPLGERFHALQGLPAGSPRLQVPSAAVA